MRIYHLSAECYPIAKVGGLADVVGALPKYQNQAGLNAAVVIPYYNRKFVHENTFEVVFQGLTLLGDRRIYFEIVKETTDKLGFELFMIKVPGLLDRENIYSYPDEREQFLAFQICFLDWINWSGQTPDVVHCHDHHTGLVPFLMYHSALYRRLAHIPTVFTIHNGQYHGAFGWEKLNYLPEIDALKTGLLEWAGGINPLACAVKCCWKYTTVSPNYLHELTINSNGLEYLFWVERAKGVGIVNGIDTDVWNTESDPMVLNHFNTSSVDKGKKANKKELCDRFNLDINKPLVVFIGRLVVEKGADLLPEAIERSIRQHPNGINFLILGTGDKETELAMQALKGEFPQNCNVFIGYDEALAHVIYAGADFLLMPSRVEPCGLNQLYAIRYGTIPVVRTTGGLKDTVIDLDEAGGYGIRFENATADDITYSMARAVELYQDTKKMQLLRKRMMGLDFSWGRSAQEYINLYNSLIPQP